MAALRNRLIWPMLRDALILTSSCQHQLAANSVPPTERRASLCWHGRLPGRV